MRKNSIPHFNLVWSEEGRLQKMIITANKCKIQTMIKTIPLYTYAFYPPIYPLFIFSHIDVCVL